MVHTLLSTAAQTAPATGSFESGAWLLVAVPLLSAAVLLLAGRRADRWGHWRGVAASAFSFLLGLGVLGTLYTFSKNKLKTQWAVLAALSYLCAILGGAALYYGWPAFN